jgi:hypothetical protein
MIDNYSLLLHKLSLKYRIPLSELKKLVESQFEFIQEKTKELDFKKIETEEEFNNIKTNFNVMYLFTLHAKYKPVEIINKKVKQKEDGREQNKNGREQNNTSI